MNQLVPRSSRSFGSLPVPAVVAAAGDSSRTRLLEFLAMIRNPHTRRASSNVVGKFLA